MHGFGHPFPQFLERNVPHTGFDADEIVPGGHLRHDLSGGLTELAPTPVALRRLSHPTRHGIGNPAGEICRERRLVVYPYRTGATTAAGPSQRRKAAAAANPLEGDRCRTFVALQQGCGLCRRRRRRRRQVRRRLSRTLRRRAWRDHGGDGLSGWPGRRESTSDGGSRASENASGCSAETCASSCSLLQFWREARLHGGGYHPGAWPETVTRHETLRLVSAFWTRQTRRREGRFLLYRRSGENFKRASDQNVAGTGLAEQDVPAKCVGDRPLARAGY